MNQHYRLGVIGLGRVAWLLERDELRDKPCTHLGAWQRRDDVSLVAACDSDETRRAEFAAHFPDVHLYTDYRQMLAEENLDLLSVCAYASERCDMVVDAAEAGVRGIWCEKAMAGSLAEARRMEAALARNDTAMVVSFMRRWAPPYYAVKRLLDEGAIGELESVNVHFSSNMLHTGTHAFDVLRLWCGEVASLQAWLDTGDEEAAQSGYRFGAPTGFRDFGGFALLDFENAVRATVHARGKRYFRFEFELLGSRGLIRIGNTQQELWTTAESPHFTGFTELSEVPFPESEPANIWCAAADNLIEAVEGRAESLCTATDGRQSLAIALATHLSHFERRRVTLDEVPDTLLVPSR